MSLILHAFPASPRSFKVIAATAYLGIDCKLHVVDLTAGEQKAPAFQKLNPNCRVPVLEDGDFSLWESNAILQYLTAKQPGVMPMDERGRADVARWLFWDTAHWDPCCAIFMYENVVKPMMKAGPADPAEIAKGEAKFALLAPVLDGHLKTHRFLCGGRPSVADFAIASPLAYMKQAGLPLSAYGEILRWYGEIAALPAWKQACEYLLPAAA